MTILSDTEIQRAIESGEIIISDFDASHLEPASYDFKVGRILMAGKGIMVHSSLS